MGRTRFYRSEVGFNRRVNTNNLDWFVRYQSEPKPKAKFISWRVYNNVSTNFDWQGRHQNANNEAQLQLRFKRETFVGFGIEKGYERVFESEFGPTRNALPNCLVNNNCTFAGNDDERSAPNTGVYFYTESTPSKKYSFNVFAKRGWGQLDYDLAPGPGFRALVPLRLPPGMQPPAAFAIACHCPPCAMRRSTRARANPFILMVAVPIKLPMSCASI